MEEEEKHRIFPPPYIQIVKSVKERVARSTLSRRLTLARTPVLKHYQFLEISSDNKECTKITFWPQLAYVAAFKSDVLTIKIA